MQAATINLGTRTSWDAWAFNGTMPGPTLRARVGDIIRVHVKNNLDLVHSLHSHLGLYPLASDGSQVNVIANVGPGAMIPLGGEYTYEFQVTNPGIFYYHCHSADGNLRIVDHILQGLYGAIIVYGSEEKPPEREYVIFMSEIHDLYHSFHLHGMTLNSVYYFPGRQWAGNVVQLLLGAAEAIDVTPNTKASGSSTAT